MATITVDVTGVSQPQLAVDAIVTKINSSVVPSQHRKGVSFSFTYQASGKPATMTITTPSQVVLDQVANIVRRLKLMGNKVADVVQVRLTAIPAEVSPFQAYI